jgi:VWFA-related protein
MYPTNELGSYWRLGRIAALCLLVIPLVGANRAQDNATSPATPVPDVVMALSSIGYRPDTKMIRLVHPGTIFLGFVDEDHVLFSFNRNQLFERSRDCPSSHDDWIAHAAIVEVPSGKIVRETDWYLHDRRRYLWPLGQKQFLLRKLNSLYLVDQDLEPKLVFTSPAELLWVAVTPDNRQIILETPVVSAPQNRKEKKQTFRIDVLDTKTLKSEKTFEVGDLVTLEGTTDGYPDALHAEKIWMIRFGPSAAERRNIIRVRTRVQPLVVFPSNNSMLIGRCPGVPCRFSVSSFTTSGRRLWRQHWERERHFPSVTRDETNTRFALSSLILAVEPQQAADVNPALEPTGLSDYEALEQVVDVLETASGTPLLSVRVFPPVLSGQNVALSQDGRRLAVVVGTSINIYDLPPITVEEQARFTALKADVPGLYVVGSQTDSSTASEPGSDDATIASATGEFASLLNHEPTAGPSPPLPGDGTGLSETAIPSFKTSSRVVVLDVVVTNDKGEPVKGLSQTDFKLAEDGKTQTVSHFTDVAASPRQQSNAPSPSTPKNAPNVFTNAKHATVEGAVNLILLDLLNTPVSDQVYARNQLMQFLKNKPPDAQFALAVLTPGQSASLRLIQGFTADENTLLAAMNKKDVLPREARWEAAQAASNATLRSMVNLASGDANNNWGSALQSMQEMQSQVKAAYTDERVGMTVDALTHIARYLSGLPGRKSLIWMSGSFPMAISPGAAANLRITENRNYTAKVKQATNLLAEGQVAVYPVDVRGLIENGDSVVDNNFVGLGQVQQRRTTPGRSLDIGVPNANGDSTPNLDEILQQAKDQTASTPEEHNTMNQFATDTGGQAFFNTNAIDKAVDVATRQGSNYYSLSYTPTNKDYSGKFRKIKVSLAQNGYHLHYRRGYYAADASSPTISGDASSGIGNAAMQHGSPLAAQVHFVVRVVPVGSKTRKEATLGAKRKKSSKTPSAPVFVDVQRYRVDYAIDSSDLRFQGAAEIPHLELGIEVASYTGEGNRISNMAGIWSNDFKSEAMKDVLVGGVRIHQEIDVPTSAAFLRLGIQDRTSSRLGTIELPLPVPAPPDVPRIKKSLPEIEAD